MTSPLTRLPPAAVCRWSRSRCRLRRSSPSCTPRGRRSPSRSPSRSVSQSVTKPNRFALFLDSVQPSLRCFFEPVFLPVSLWLSCIGLTEAAWKSVHSSRSATAYRLDVLCPSLCARSRSSWLFHSIHLLTRILSLSSPYVAVRHTQPPLLSTLACHPSSPPPRGSGFSGFRLINQVVMHSSARAEGRAKWDEENQARLAEEERMRCVVFCGVCHIVWRVALG